MRSRSPSRIRPRTAAGRSLRAVSSTSIAQASVPDRHASAGRCRAGSRDESDEAGPHDACAMDTG